MRAAAYQTGTELTHHGVRVCSVSIDHRKGLNKGLVSDELRRELADQPLFTAPLNELDALRNKTLSPELREMFDEQGIVLSERLTFYPSQSGVTIRDRGPAPKMAADPGKRQRSDPNMCQTYRLHVEDDRLVVTRRNGVQLSGDAVAAKGDKRGHWIITDGDDIYQVREYTRRRNNPETGKREVVEKGLDISGDRTFSYQQKKDVRASWLEVPETAPERAQEMAAESTAICAQMIEGFFNEVEHADPSRDGRPAQMFELGFLRELTDEQNRAALRRFTEEHFTGKGLAVLVSIHEVQASDGQPNRHVHLLVPTRQWDVAGNFATQKGQWLDGKQMPRQLRQSWAAHLNTELDRAGVNQIRVDPRSYAERGIAKTPGQHLGPQQAAMEERGIETTWGDNNRTTDQKNTVHEIIQGRRPDPAVLLERADSSETLPDMRTPHDNVDIRHYSTLRGVLRDTIRSIWARAMPQIRGMGMNDSAVNDLAADNAAQPHNIWRRLLRDQRSGSSPQAIEQMGRVAEWTRERAAAGRSFLERFMPGWSQRETLRREQMQRRETEREQTYER